MLSLFRNLKAKQHERRIDAATKSAWMLVKNRPYDIVLMYKNGFVDVRGVGQDITRVNIEIENLTRVPISLVVKPGAYFKSAGEHQNMASTRYFEYELSPLEKVSCAVDAACINAQMPIPTEHDGFAGVEHTGTTVSHFLETASGRDSKIIQVGVWAITDGMSGHAIQQRLVAAQDGSQLIFDYHVEMARELLDQLNIQHRL